MRGWAGPPWGRSACLEFPLVTGRARGGTELPWAGPGPEALPWAVLPSGGGAGGAVSAMEGPGSGAAGRLLTEDEMAEVKKDVSGGSGREAGVPVARSGGVGLGPGRGSGSPVSAGA